MKEMIINGKTIKTNYRDSGYSIGNGIHNGSIICSDFRESNKEFLERLVNKGYTRIVFYEETTRVRGFHKIYAVCR